MIMSGGGWAWDNLQRPLDARLPKEFQSGLGKVHPVWKKLVWPVVDGIGSHVIMEMIVNEIRGGNDNE